MNALKLAQKSNPTGRWWIKADACDIRQGLRESMCGVWAGDEDLGDGTIQKLYSEYRARCAAVKSLKSTTIDSLLMRLKLDLEFLLTGEREAKTVYEKALSATRMAQNTVMELAWDTIGYEELIKTCNCFIEELGSFANCPQSATSVKGLQSLQIRLLKYLRDLYSKKRSAASHLLVFMISDELRNFKPYAIPVQFLSYKSITDAKTRDLAKQLEDAMTRIGMIVVGQYFASL